MTRIEFETALDSGNVKFRMTSGKLWMVKRNGKTKTWKTRPDEFSIPVKVGFRSCTHVTHETLLSDTMKFEIV